jgi:hypothetical protein
MEKIFGGNPWAVALRLVIVCIITGIVLAALGLDPTDLLRSIPNLIRWLSELGWGWVETAAQYFLLGAIIVIPIWVIIRVFKFIGGDNDSRTSR